MTNLALEPASGAWIDVLSVLFSGLAAVGGTVAVVIAMRALRVSRRASAVEQLFSAAADVTAALQDVGRRGQRLADPERSRHVLSDSLLGFETARARFDLALHALRASNEYRTAVLDVAQTFAVSVVQADEFSKSVERFTAEDLRDLSWARGMSWANPAELETLARSVIFREVRHAAELIPVGVHQLGGMPERWGRRVLDCGNPDTSVYSVSSSYLTQTSRLVDDFTREFVQTMFGECVREVSD